VDGRGELAVVLEYVHGVSLAYLLDHANRERTTVPRGVVLCIGIELCAALEATHAIGFAHADVNPRNILVATNGATKLCDFGLACVESSSALTPSLRGTAAYAAPETVQSGIIDRRSDVFSAAVTIWEALRVERLFRAASEPETLRRVVEMPAPLVHEGHPALADLSPILAAALEKDPKARTRSAADLGQALSEHGPASREDVAKLVRSWGKPELQRRDRAMRHSQ
jgi:serine/threonine-protein kinase